MNGRGVLVFVAIMSLGACSKKTAGSSGPCATAYANARSLGLMGGERQGFGASALIFGTACLDFTKDDLACIEKATTASQLRACGHALQVLITTGSKAMQSGHHGGDAKPDPRLADALQEITDAVCECDDSACLVGVGQHHRSAIDVMNNAAEPTGDSTIMAVSKRMGQCFEMIVENDQARLYKAGTK